MFSWGAVTIGNAGVQSAASLSGVRCLLSAFESREQPMSGYTSYVMS